MFGAGGRMGTRAWRAAVLAVVVAFGMLIPVASGGPEPSVGTGSGAAETWAYGGQVWQNTTIITSSYTSLADSYYAWQDVTTATNTSNSTAEIEGSLTWTYTDRALYCAPNCSAPSTYYNLTLSEWGTTHSFVNVTSSATVYEANTTAHGTTYRALPAFGFSDAKWVSASNYSERYVYQVNHSLVYQGSAFAAANSTYSAGFAPALGLVPWNLSAAHLWNSTSHLAVRSLSDSDYHYWFVGLSYDSLSHGTAFAKSQQNSTESLTGENQGNTTLANGQNASQVLLAFQGAFNVSYGIFGAPVNTDLFGGATANWSVGVIYGALTATPHLAIVLGTHAAIYRIVAATASWSSAVRVVGLPGLHAVPAPAPLRAASSGTAQGQPEPIAYALTTARCMVHACGTSAPVSAAGSSVPGWPLALLVATAATIAAIGLYGRPRRGTPSGGPVTRTGR